MSVTPKNSWPWVKTLLHSVYGQPDATSVHSQFESGLLDTEHPRRRTDRTDPSGPPGELRRRRSTEVPCRTAPAREPGGISRAKSPRTTKPAPETGRPTDLVERRFTAIAANRLWVAHITYIRSFAGWVYAAFILDVFSRRIVGWQVSTRLYKELALDTLDMGTGLEQRTGPI